MSVDISIIAGVVVSMFIMLLLGYGAKKLKWVGDTTSKQLSLFLVRIGQPMLIISSQIKVGYSPDILKNGLIVFAIGIVAHGLLALLAYFACRGMKDVNRRKISEFAMIFANCGFIGYPVINAIMGPEGVFYASFYVVTFHLYTWTWGMVILGRERTDIKINLKSMLINFGTVPSAIGVGLYLSRIDFPAFFTNALSSVGDVCTPLSLFLCGMLLAKLPLRKLITRPSVYYVALMKLVVFPLLLTLCAKLVSAAVGLPDLMVYMTAILTSMPCASVAVMFTELYDIEQEYAAQLVGITTVLCVATVPFVAWISGFIVGI